MEWERKPAPPTPRRPATQHATPPTDLRRLALAGNAAVARLMRTTDGPDGPRAPTTPNGVERRPDARDGHRPLAHGIARTAQRSGPTGGSALVGEPDSPEERHADRTAGQPAAGVAPAGPAVRPGPAPGAPATPGAQASSTEQTRLRSPDPAVNGKTVSEVAADLSARDQRYRQGIDQFRANAWNSRQTEQDWYAKLGAMGAFIDWFNPAPRTDPARWQDVLHRWDLAASAFDVVLAERVVPRSINELGRASATAMRHFDDAYRLDTADRAQFAAYLQGFQRSGQGVLTTATTVRDIAFAAAVGIAVVALAPEVAGALAAKGAGTLLTYAGTAAAMGAVGAGMEGAGQATATLAAQTIDYVVDLVHGSERAADNFDLGRVGREGWDGMKRGFVDGALAVAAVEAEKALASVAGPVIRGMLGPNRVGLLAMIIRRALTRAVSGGATGSVVGALQAGLVAAMNHQDLAGIATAMEKGFVVGATAGAVVGATGGAVEAHSASRLREAVVPEFARAASEGPNQDIQPAVFKTLHAQLVGAPGVGSNDELARLLPSVWAALRDPHQFAEVLADVWLEEHLLGMVVPKDAVVRYGEAVLALSRRTGAPVVILRNTVSFRRTDFYEKVVLGGFRFLDLSILKGIPEHGASTHAIQDLVVDRALVGTGLRAEQLRQLLGGAVDMDGNPIGNILWKLMYDGTAGGLNQPEKIYPIMNRALGGLL